MSSKRICLRALRTLNQPIRVNSQIQPQSRLIPQQQLRFASAVPSRTRKQVNKDPAGAIATPLESKPTATPIVPPTTTATAPGDEVELSSDPRHGTFASWMRSGTATMAETYVSFEATYRLFEACGSMADYTVPNAKNKKEEIPTLPGGEQVGVGNGGWWYEELQIQPTFSNWAHITMLHMWLLLVRFRAFPRKEATEIYHRHLVDHFSFIAEQRMAEFHRITSRSQRNNFLKDIYLQWRGMIAGFDEGLVKDDAVLASAVWRNIFGAREDVEWEKVAMVVAFMRRSLVRLGELPDEEVVDAVVGEESDSIFEIFDHEAKIVAGRSKGIDESIRADSADVADNDAVVKNAMKSAKV